jgi:hypothetical protein
MGITLVEGLIEFCVSYEIINIYNYNNKYNYMCKPELC